MKTVWKYQVKTAVTKFCINAPGNFEVLHVGEQDGFITLWYVVDTDKPNVRRWFCIVGTGNPISPGWDMYIGTAQVGSFVFHVFERP